ncbi:MFS transporter [Kocuria rhizophila]|uniref:MFS transporter n=1 Tax=Kocuria rhizophila TaxID=72000 RepID=UPI002D1F9E96|nr:MFS transporter [Kocuria rhizophila]
MPGRLVLGVGTYLFGNAGFFVLTTFMISYVTKQLGMPSTVILTAITWGAVAEIITMGVAGKVADRTSPSIVVVVGYAVAAVLAVPIFLLVDTRSAALITVAMILGIGFASIPYAPVGTMLTQLFPVKVRYSAIALCANIAGVVAGFMPALAAWILGLTGGTSTGPTLLLLALALISLVSSLLARRVIRRDEERDVDQISGDLLNR